MKAVCKIFWCGKVACLILLHAAQETFSTFETLYLREGAWCFYAVNMTGLLYGAFFNGI